MVDTFLVDNCTFNGCNKSCSYCREDKTIKGNREAVVRSLDLLESNVDANILKISGYGEITLLTDWKEILSKHDSACKSIQIITNGTALKEADLEFLAARHYVLCVSLDGITTFSNQARNSSDREIKQILKNLRHASSSGIPLEINTVLTLFNINHLGPLLDFVNDVGGICYPFPVRENRLYGSGDSLKPSHQDVEKNVGKLIQAKDLPLPPKAYMESLLNFMLHGTRSTCYVPKVVMGISPEGDLVKCPCSGTKKISNIFLDGKMGFEKYFNQRNFGGNDEECADCFTHYEVLNLFVEGKISPEEMRVLPLFKNQDLTQLMELSK